MLTLNNIIITLFMTLLANVSWADSRAELMQNSFTVAESDIENCVQNINHSTKNIFVCSVDVL
ncbi:MAG: hypothetical protein KDD40_12275, partial [Bdellovibrionales bacterium]|nr:hypothetical protein [Bdellovibrionales bacterium]